MFFVRYCTDYCGVRQDGSSSAATELRQAGGRVGKKQEGLWRRNWGKTGRKTQDWARPGARRKTQDRAQDARRKTERKTGQDRPGLGKKCPAGRRARVKRPNVGCSQSPQEAPEGGRTPPCVPSGRGPLRGPRDKYPRFGEGKPTRAELPVVILFVCSVVASSHHSCDARGIYQESIHGEGICRTRGANAPSERTPQPSRVPLASPRLPQSLVT